MSFITQFFHFLFSGMPVSASNAARGRKCLPVPSDAGDFTPQEVVREISRRMIALLRDDSREIEFKDLCAGLQRVQPLLPSDETASAAGLSDEALAEMEREAGLV